MDKILQDVGETFLFQWEGGEDGVIEYVRFVTAPKASIILQSNCSISFSFRIDDYGLITSTEKVTPQLVPGIVVADVGTLEPGHALHQVRLGRVESEVVVVVHENPGANFPA